MKWAVSGQLQIKVQDLQEISEWRVGLWRSGWFRKGTWLPHNVEPELVADASPRCVGSLMYVSLQQQWPLCLEIQVAQIYHA